MALQDDAPTDDDDDDNHYNEGKIFLRLNKITSLKSVNGTIVDLNLTTSS